MSTPDDRPLATGTIIANNYRVTTRLGAGGMGTVYLADNVTLKQRVVVKVLRGGPAGAGQEEAQLLANLQHPHVVTVFAHDPAHDCIVMEYLDGSSLSALLEKGIDRVTAIRVALAIAEALAAVHKRGLVHRDIKPDNVMLVLNPAGGRPVDWLKLIDFGVALKAGKVPPDPLGTPEFCPPEQFDRGTPAHPANDVYALGVNLFLLLAGKLPFEGDVPTLTQLHHEAPPPSLVTTLVERYGETSFEPRTRALLDDLDELLQQMMAKRVEARPTAADAARALIRLETNFADAGTFVGKADQATIRHLKPVKSRTLAITALKVDDAGDDGATTDKRPALQPRQPAAPRPSGVRTAMATPGPDALAPVPRRPSGARPAVTATPAEALEPAPPAGPSKGLIGGLLALVLALAAGVAWSLHEPESTESEGAAPPRADAGTRVTPRVDTPTPTALEPTPSVPPTTRVEPEVGSDAGPPPPPEEPAVVEDEATPDAVPVPGVAVKPKQRTPKRTGCVYTEDSWPQYRERAKATRARAKTDAARQAIDDLEDALFTALKERQDCEAAEVIISRMRRLADR